MIQHIERRVMINGKLFVGIKELGMDPGGSLIMNLYTTPGPEPRGSWFSTVPISARCYRERHPTRTQVSMRKGLLMVSDDYGNVTRIGADPDLLEQLMLDCRLHEIPLAPEGRSGRIRGTRVHAPTVRGLGQTLRKSLSQAQESLTEVAMLDPDRASVQDAIEIANSYLAGHTTPCD